ncbi:unnamed protein product [Rhizoctonia solani]|uniref:Uncharacterized protein n=1 Tax=Rhizoctonia solani TaxID=456999 RepID=A0A8H3DKP7_9AGAM|nr:unnamed protein product [Rhizoctonia solani]
MPKLPFAALPSAPPPGSSHYTCNSLIIAKRVARNLEEPVRIKLDGWWKGNPFFDWYERHRHSRIQSMQLRKEKQAPFFHEYVTFKLSDGRCFRIDRRQLPEERSPMDCAVDKGVEAFDTIEQITDLEDSMYSPSERLIQFDFKAAIRLSLVVNRYNCYFYAQTMMFCTLCRVYKWEENDFWKNLIESNPRTPTKNNTFWRAPVQVLLGKLKDSRTSAMQEWGMQESDIGSLQKYLSDMIHTHSLRVEQYKFVLKCSAEDVERDIKMGMDEIWSRWSKW